MRNVFVEGNPERYEHAKRLIEAIIEEVWVQFLNRYSIKEMENQNQGK